MIRFASFCYALGVGMDSNIKLRLEAFSERLSGPMGSVPLDRAIRADLDLFRSLREAGASWPQIARALAAAGARRADGSIIPADHVRSAVTRQMKRTSTEEKRQFSPDHTGLHQQPHVTRSTPPTARIKQPNHSLSEKIELTGKGEESPGKISTQSENISDDRNKSILEKLARTRKLRES